MIKTIQIQSVKVAFSNVKIRIHAFSYWVTNMYICTDEWETGKNEWPKSTDEWLKSTEEWQTGTNEWQTGTDEWKTG